MRQLLVLALLGGARARPTTPPLSLQARVINTLHSAVVAGSGWLAHGFSREHEDWLVLAGKGTCLNHDLRFGECGESSGWTVGPDRVAHGASCLATGGFMGVGLALVPCDGKAAEGRLLGARYSRLCAGMECERCASVPTAFDAVLEDGCAHVLTRSAPRRWAALIAALVGGM